MILGKLDLQWRNYFGDSGNLLIGPYKASFSAQRQIDLQPCKPTLLKMEQSQKIKFRLHNMSDRQLNLDIKLKEGKFSSECLITDVSPS